MSSPPPPSNSNPPKDKGSSGHITILKYSVATLLLCTSSVTAYLYFPYAASVISGTVLIAEVAIPLAIFAVSAVVALVSVAYLVRSVALALKKKTDSSEKESSQPDEQSTQLQGEGKNLEHINENDQANKVDGQEKKPAPTQTPVNLSKSISPISSASPSFPSSVPLLPSPPLPSGSDSDSGLSDDGAGSDGGGLGQPNNQQHIKYQEPIQEFEHNNGSDKVRYDEINEQGEKPVPTQTPVNLSKSISPISSASPSFPSSVPLLPSPPLPSGSDSNSGLSDDEEQTQSLPPEKHNDSSEEGNKIPESGYTSDDNMNQLAHASEPSNGTNPPSTNVNGVDSSTSPAYPLNQRKAGDRRGYIGMVTEL